MTSVYRVHRDKGWLHTNSKYNMEAVKFWRWGDENNAEEKGHLVTAAVAKTACNDAFQGSEFALSLAGCLTIPTGASSWLKVWTCRLAPAAEHLELVRKPLAFLFFISPGPLLWCSLSKCCFITNEWRKQATRGRVCVYVLVGTTLEGDPRICISLIASLLSDTRNCMWRPRAIRQWQLHLLESLVNADCFPVRKWLLIWSTSHQFKALN